MHVLNNLAIGAMRVVATADPISNAFTQAATDMKSQITTIAPIGIGVLTAGLVVTFGVKFFKRITGKA